MINPIWRGRFAIGDVLIPLRKNDPVVALIHAALVSRTSSRAPWRAARFISFATDRQTAYNRFAQISHDMIDAVALSSAACNSGDFGPIASLLGLMHH